MSELIGTSDSYSVGFYCELCGNSQGVNTGVAFPQLRLCNECKETLCNLIKEKKGSPINPIDDSINHTVPHNIEWIKKNQFVPVEGEYYWVIIPRPDSTVGFYVPYTACYTDGLYRGQCEGDMPELDNPNISHVAKIVYPSK